MKKRTLFGCACVALACVALAACASGKTADRSTPDFVREAIRLTPEDCIVGVGTSAFKNTQTAMNAANLAAQADVARQAEVIIQQVREAWASASQSAATESDFYKEYTRAEVKKALSNTQRIAGDFHTDGSYWEVLMMEKEEFRKIVNANEQEAVNAAAYEELDRIMKAQHADQAKTYSVR